MRFFELASRSTTFDKYVDEAVNRLSRLNSVSGLSEMVFSYSETEHYFKDKRFIDWLASHGITVSDLPPHRDGGQGRAYFVGNDRVVKFIGDKDDAEMAALCIESRIPDVTLQEIVKIDEHYAIMQEEVQTSPFPTGLIYAGYLVKQYVEKHKDLAEPSSAKGILSPKQLIHWNKAEVEKNPTGQLAWYHKQMDKMFPYIRLILRSVFQILDKTGRLWLDIHHNNMGFDKQAKLKIFDTGVSHMAWNQPIPEIRTL